MKKANVIDSLLQEYILSFKNGWDEINLPLLKVIIAFLIFSVSSSALSHLHEKRRVYKVIYQYSTIALTTHIAIEHKAAVKQSLTTVR